MMAPKMKFVPLMIFQIILMVLFLVFVKHGEETRHKTTGFEDTHVMIFIGFGFLMTFLQKYGYSATGLNLLLAALAIQWALICQNAYNMKDGTIYITKKSILESDIMSATVLITFGALLGVASSLQLLVIAVVEIAVATFNLHLIEKVFKAPDVGGSMAIHAFGAYFGLGVSLGLRKKKTQAEGEAVPAESSLNGPTYISDITAMIGTLFLWIYWPSFNSALTASDSEYQRAVINTYLSLAAATVTTFVMSSLVSHDQGKFDMVHVQNSTLAGGVAVGSVCNLMICPGGAIAIGIGAGILSVMGYRFLTPKLTKMGILDTCGVNNLHGMPGVYSGLISIVMAALATKDLYGDELNVVYGAMQDGRTAGNQALFQLAALACTVVLAFVSGSLTGLCARLSLFKGLQETEKYNDEVDWELPK